MRLKPIFFSLALLFIFSHPVFAAQSQVTKVVLDNGLTVLIQELPASEVTSIYACIKTGSATEGRYLGMGISHFIEHMLFKGTTKRPVGAIAREVKSLGGTINASTGLDYTEYTIDVPKDSFAQGLDIISDMIMNSAFDAVEIEKERKVIHGEMRLYNDRPERVLSDLVFHNVYTQHPYRHPTIGYPALFDSITHDELYTYYKSRYIPNNMILSISGSVKADQILPLIRKAFKDFKIAPYLQRNLVQEPQQTFKRYLEQYYSTSLIHFSFAYQGVSILDPDLYALDVLSMALGQGESSRLYNEAYKNKHFVEEISSSNFTPQDKGYFEIEGIMSKDHIEDVSALIKNIVGDIQKHGLSSSELEKTKRQVLAAFIFSNQTAPSLAQRALTDEALTSDPNFSKHYVDLVKSVTNEDIKRVANRYLQDSYLSRTVLKPKGMAPSKASQEASINNQGIRKIVLDNGLTILLHEDKSVLVGAIALFVHGGTRAEDASLGGIAQLTGSVWGKATTHLSEEQIALAMEQRGGSLSSASGLNTLSISMDFLSEDFDFALNLLEDLVKNPTMPQSAIDRQHQDMLIAMQQRQDNIMSFSYRALIETLYLKHPIRQDPLGTRTSLSKITRGEIVRFYKSLMYPNNMVISVFGNCDSQKVLEDLKKKFGSLKKGQVNIPLVQEAAPDKTRMKDLQMDKEQALLLMAFQAPKLKDEDRFSMEVIDNILGSGLSGRLFIKVRDELGQAYTTNSSYNPDVDTGTFMLYVLTKPDKIDSVKEIIIKQLEDLRNKDVSLEELNAAKSYLKGSLQRSLLTNDALAYTAALDELYGLGYNFYQQFYKKVDAVTVQDVRRVANKYLDISKAAIVTTTPKMVDTKSHE